MSKRQEENPKYEILNFIQRRKIVSTINPSRQMNDRWR